MMDKMISELEIWEQWKNNYNKFVPQFIEESKKNANWKDWDATVFKEFFEKNRDQCVSSLQQGYFTKNERLKIKNNWSELAQMLSKISNQQDYLDLVTYGKIRSWLKQHTSQNRKASANRLIASLQPKLLCTIVNEDRIKVLMQRINKIDSSALLTISNNWFENSNKVLNYFKSKLPDKDYMEIITYPWQIYEILNNQNKLKHTSPISNNNDMSETQNESDFLDILYYKKQIILHGPPGTGKTKTAKDICHEMISISDELIRKQIKVGMQIPTAKGQVSYKILSTNEAGFNLEREKGTTNTVTFASIISAYDGEKWKNEISNNDDRMAVAIAKYLYDNFFKDNEQVKIIQFHPSYTYEDFVRGIIAESKGEKIEYKNVNKTLGLFAKEALANFKASTNDSPEANLEAWIDEKFELYKNEIDAKLPEEAITLSGDITIFEVTDSHFKYAEKWKTPGYLKFNEFKKLIKAILQNELELSTKQLDKEKFIHAHYRYTYYNALLKLFFEQYSYEIETVKVEAKNYVLIIDEINRANLSSVLGELIYALEYRSEEVESMYEVDGSQKLILPPNLYIIGTMNTADRSVGHIDYAIRRRFAFVEVLPKDLTLEMNAGEFYRDLFNAVKGLFTTDEYYTKSDFISQEFEPKDVALGHSYFIDKANQGGHQKVRWDYEIKPILLEYVRDGVLKQSALQKIKEIEESL